MLQSVPAAILEKSQSQLSQQPMMLCAIWADNGAEDRLIDSYRLSGSGDVAAASDANIALNYAGELTISDGPAVALDTTTAASTATARRQFWTVVVKDIWKEVWA